MLLDELGAYLQSQGVGTLGTSLFKGLIPMDSVVAPVPDALVALIETPGLPSFHAHNSKEPSFEQPTLQVLVRGAAFDYQEARAHAQAVFEALDGVANTTLGTGFYLWILSLQSPFLLRMDEHGRPIIVFNVRCARASVTV